MIALQDSITRLGAANAEALEDLEDALKADLRYAEIAVRGTCRPRRQHAAPSGAIMVGGQGRGELVTGPGGASDGALPCRIFLRGRAEMGRWPGWPV